MNEDISLLRSIGLVMIVLSLIISNSNGIKFDLKIIVMCISVFILNGCVSIVLKTHQISDNAVSTNDFVIISNFFSALVGCLMAFAIRRSARRTGRQVFGFKQIFIIFMVAIKSGTSYFLQLKGAQSMPASVLYSVITGGTVIFTALGGRIFFKEKGSQKLNIGLAMCFLGTCMFL